MTLSYICIILISVYIQNIIFRIRVVYVVSHSTDTDLTLTTERLMELFASMHDEYIDHLRLYLDTPSSKKEEFNMNYKDPARRKEAYLDYYVHNNPLASWTKVAEALRWCELPKQATVVENTYVKGMHTQISCLSHDNN